VPKARHEVALEIGQLEVAQMSVHAVGVVAHDLLARRIDRNVACDTSAGGLDKDTAVVTLRKSEAQVRAMIRRSQLGGDSMSGVGAHFHRVVVGRTDFVPV